MKDRLDPEKPQNFIEEAALQILEESEAGFLKDVLDELRQAANLDDNSLLLQSIRQHRIDAITENLRVLLDEFKRRYPEDAKQIISFLIEKYINDI